jgi:putative SOS response-associated peptidase YedK
MRSGNGAGTVGSCPELVKRAEDQVFHDQCTHRVRAEKPAYRIAFKSRRCLIPADGFYEWNVVNGHKIPHHIRLRNGDVFALAGLWDHWEGEGQILDSCSIIVMPASDVMKSLHERMPALIAPAAYDLWLDARIKDKAEIIGYLNSAPSSQLVAYPISPWVNSAKHDDERCIEPAGDM